MIGTTSILGNENNSKELKAQKKTVKLGNDKTSQEPRQLTLKFMR